MLVTGGQTPAWEMLVTPNPWRWQNGTVRGLEVAPVAVELR